MRIVDRKTFLTLPAGTVFAKYEPIIIGELRIKGETVGQDFLEQALHDAWCVGDEDTLAWQDRWLKMAETGEESPRLDLDCQSRDGLFDEDQLFVIYSAQDVRDIIARLRRAIVDSTVVADPDRSWSRGSGSGQTRVTR